jgi:hypothetical protein
MTDYRKHMPAPHGAIINSDRLVSNSKGNTDCPAISFKHEPLKGFYINQAANLVHTTALMDTVEFMPSATNFLTPIIISDVGDADLNMIEVKPKTGILFKKSDDDSLWWRTANGDVNITFNRAVGGSDVLECRTEATEPATHKAELVETQAERRTEATEPTTHKAELAETQAECRTDATEPATHKAELAEPQAECRTEAAGPTVPQINEVFKYVFAQDEGTGLKQLDSGVVGLVANNAVSMAVADDQIMLYKQLSINDSEVSDPVVESDGRLYKKAGDNGLWWKTTTTEVDLTAEPPKYITPQGDNLLVKTKNSSVIINADGEILQKGNQPIYSQNIRFKTSMDISEGDLICMDLVENGRIVKGLGGKIERTGIMEESPLSCVRVFDYDSDTFVLAYTQVSIASVKIIICLVDKYDYTIRKTYNNQIVVNNISFNDIIKVNGVNYTLVYLENDTIKLISMRDVFDADAVVLSNSVQTELTCDKICVKYDTYYTIVYYNASAQEFRAMILNDNLEQTIKDTVLCNVYVQNAGKLHLLAVPGGSLVVAMGYIRFVILMSAGYIRSGDPVIDYNSMECIDALYDQSSGVVMTMEKTISDSCYVQAWDISGLNLQKLASASFVGSMTPIGISTNDVSWAALYAIDDTAYVHLFEFDGSELTIGLRYSCAGSKSPSSLFPVLGTNKFIFYMNELTSFITNYQGIPSGYIGVATESAKEGDMCAVTIKGHIYYNKIKMPSGWIGKKLYITETDKLYPYYMSITRANGIFMGTCLDQYRIILGL